MSNCEHCKHRIVYIDYVYDGEFSNEQWRCAVRDDERCVWHCEKYEKDTQ